MRNNKELESQPTQREITLLDLMRDAEPLLRHWTELENEKHRRESEFRNNQLKEMSSHGRLVTLGLFGILGIIVIITAILFFLGRESSAMELIKLVVGLGGAVFGGYGWAMRRRR